MPLLPRSGLSPQRQWAGACVAAAGLPVMTALLVAGRDRLSYATPVLLVLLLVVLVALVGGLRPALPAALLGALSLNYYFTPPVHRLTVERPEDLVVLAAFVTVAVSVSVVVDLAARRTTEAARAAAEAQALSSVAGATLGEQETLPALLDRVRVVFGASEVAMLDQVAGVDVPVATVGAPGADDTEQVVAAGPTARLVVRGPQLFAEDRRVLAAFAEAAATALRRRRSTGCAPRCWPLSATTCAPRSPGSRPQSRRCARATWPGRPRRPPSCSRPSRSPPTGCRPW